MPRWHRKHKARAWFVTPRDPGNLRALACLLALLCLAPGGRPQPGARRFVAVTPAPAAPDPARLSVVATDQLTDGQQIALRAVVRNDGNEPVEGVRLVLKLLAAPDAGARELDRFYKFMDVRLAPGATQMVRWDVYTTYAGEVGPTGFLLEAYAVRKGSVTFPPPPDWRE
ncbi:MAG: hypothetical protein N3C12_16030 [Candidatus Binatia bacterium]|nr:hypothetical protein [Candidatus Binatia bacterium]